MKHIYMECTLLAMMNGGILTEGHVNDMLKGYDFKSVGGVKYFVLLENGGKQDNTPPE